MVVRQSRHMLTYAKTKPKVGSRADGLWTAKSGHAEQPGRGSVSLNPKIWHVEKHEQKTVNKNEPVAAKPVRRSVTVERLSMYAAGKKEKKKEPRGGKACWLQSQNGGRLRGTLRGRYSQAKRKGVKRKRPMGWGASAGSIIWDLKGSQQEADGLQRGTLIRYVRRMRAVNVTPMVTSTR